MPTALVTGAAGFIGSNLSETLLEQGYEVRGIDDLSTGKTQNLQSFQSHDDFQFHEGDIRNEQVLDSLSTDVDHVFHQGAIASVPRSIKDPVESTDVNCTGTATVLEAAVDNDVESVVIASSAAVYGSGGDLPKRETMDPAPESPYASSKLYTEELAQEFSSLKDIRVTALRYFNVYGPRQDIESDYAAVIPIFITQMLEGKQPTIYGDGEQTRDFVYVDTVVEANIQAARNSLAGEVINIGTGKQVSINTLVEMVDDILDAEIEPQYADPRPGDVRHSYADISKARKLLGLDDTVDLYEGLERTIQYYQSHLGNTSR